MVFMDTALTIVTGACAERWKFITFAVTVRSSWARSQYPIYGNWAWGAGWLSQLGTNVGLGKRLTVIRRIGRCNTRSEPNSSGRMHESFWSADWKIQPRWIKQSDHGP